MMFWSFSIWWGLSCFVALSVGLHVYLYRSRKSSSSKAGQICNRNILLLTAHPDDECMFFSPTIVSLTPHNTLHLLCLSAGDHCGLGKTREREILKSAAILGIPPANVKVVDDSSLPDDPAKTWDAKTIQQYVVSYCSQHGLDMIITFDEYGVSGHLNHQSLYLAVSAMADKGGIPQDVFVLESVAIWRKYVSLLDLPWSYCRGQLTLVSCWPEVFTAQRAMAAHWSQFVWFRALYVLFSRYMIINTLRPLTDCGKGSAATRNQWSYVVMKHTHGQIETTDQGHLLS